MRDNERLVAIRAGVEDCERLAAIRLRCADDECRCPITPPEGRWLLSCLDKARAHTKEQYGPAEVIVEPYKEVDG